MRVTEPGSDLAVILSILSSFRDKTLPTDLIAFGEVGLSGEIRPVPNGQERLKEAAKHGFKYAIIPEANKTKSNTVDGIKIIPVKRLGDAITQVLAL